MTEEYKKYIRSPSWRRKKQEQLAVDGGKCAMCGGLRQEPETAYNAIILLIKMFFMKTSMRIWCHCVLPVTRRFMPTITG